MLLASSSVLVISHMLGCLQSIMLSSPFIFMFHLLIPYPAFSVALIELPNTTAIVNHPAVSRNTRSDTPPSSIFKKKHSQNIQAAPPQYPQSRMRTSLYPIADAKYLTSFPTRKRDSIFSWARPWTPKLSSPSLETSGVGANT